QSIAAYYDTSNHFAQIAFAGWRREPQVSDRDFVVGALQASQIYTTGLNNDTWSQIYGSERLGTMDDGAMRKDLALLMTTDYSAMERELYSNYRQHAREIIPADVQDAIRQQCGDRSEAGAVDRLILPPTCNLHYSAPRIVVAAADLRAHPDFTASTALSASAWRNRSMLATIPTPSGKLRRSNAARSSARCG